MRTPESTGFAAAFALVARRQPEALAALDDRVELSFATLRRRAVAVGAWLLDAHEVGPPQRVALLSPNAPEALVGLLGILGVAAGAVLLDPASPAERLVRMLDLARPTALLVHPRLQPLGQRLASAAGVPLYVLGEQELDREFPLRASAPRRDATVVFTSGSSGQPKGCVESEADLLERCHSCATAFGFGPGEVFGVVHHLAGARMASCSALLSGATLAFYDFSELGLAPLPQWLKRHRVTGVRLFPTTLRQLSPALAQVGCLPALHTLVLTGEPVQAADLARLRQAAPALTCHYVYASTEAGLMASYSLAPGALAPTGRLPLGRVAPGKRLLVLDAAGAQVAVGEVGEIVLESRQVFQGYLGAAPAVQARLSGPDADGYRRFHTGDLARRGADGEFTHAGRSDAMVKVRGHRIEPAEVEAALLAQPGVAHAAVQSWQRHPGVDSLMAFVVPAAGVVLDLRELRERIGLLLPPGLLPSRIDVLQAPPLGSTGKLQRDALPCPAPPERGRAARFADPTQAALATIWSDLLGTLALTPQTDFFEAGGDSLLAATMLLDAEALFGVRLALSVLAERRTLAAVAAAIGAPGARRAEPSLVSLRRGGSRRPLFAIAGVNGHVLRFVQLAQDLEAEQPLFGLQPPGLCWAGVTDIEQMARHYVAQMRSAQRHGPYRLIGGSFGGLVAFEVALQLERAGESVQWLCLLDTRAPGPRTDLSPDQAELDPLTALSELVRVHLRAQRAYRPGRRLAAPVHHVLAAEYPLQAPDPRDWRPFLDGPLVVHAAAGVHGAFHAPPQRATVSAVLAGLCADADRLRGMAPASVFDRPVPAAIRHAGALLEGAIEEVARRGPVLQVRGWCGGARGRGPAERLAVFAGETYLGWALPMRQPPAHRRALPGRAALCGFDLKLTLPPASGEVRIVALDGDGRALGRLQVAT